jgi:hypothetical protein
MAYDGQVFDLNQAERSTGLLNLEKSIGNGKDRKVQENAKIQQYKCKGKVSLLMPERSSREYIPDCDRGIASLSFLNLSAPSQPQSPFH